MWQLVSYRYFLGAGIFFSPRIPCSRNIYIYRRTLINIKTISLSFLKLALQELEGEGRREGEPINKGRRVTVGKLSDQVVVQSGYPQSSGQKQDNELKYPHS